MIRLLSVGDVHICDKAPGSRIDDYKETVKGKILEIRDIAIARAVDAVLFTGDLFHIKAATKNSHGLIAELIAIFKTFPCPVYIIPGNHDMKYDRPDTIPTQPLGVLLASGVLLEATPEGSLLTDSSGTLVRIAGTDYNEADPGENCAAVKKNAGEVLVTLGHFYAGPEGGMFFEHRRMGYPELAEFPTDIWVLGHFHIDQGVQEVAGKTFINIGSLTRGSLDEDNLTRQVKTCYIEIDGCSWTTEEIPLTMAPASEVFDLNKYEERKEEKAAIASFIAQVNSGLNGNSSYDIMGGLLGLNLEADMLKDILRRVSEAEAGV